MKVWVDYREKRRQAHGTLVRFFIAGIFAFCTNKISNHQLHLLISFLGMFGSLRMATISMTRCVSFTLMIATSNASGSSTENIIQGMG